MNLASVPADSHAERERLLLMARKLYRFASLLMVVAIALGLCCGSATASARVRTTTGCTRSSCWSCVAIGYHHACRSLLRKFEQFANKRSERWFRVFNESAVLLFTAIVVLVVVKPF